jgi:hypothetical protein
LPIALGAEEDDSLRLNGVGDSLRNGLYLNDSW